MSIKKRLEEDVKFAINYGVLNVITGKEKVNIKYAIKQVVLIV